jgi:cysteinyl-tRNA synthetase
MKYLGATIDIHGGGLENQFPHHECEIAQSESANGVQFVRYWMHNNMVTVDGQKMGKSLNNFITLKQAFKGEHDRLNQSYDPLAIRQLILNSHYRSPLDFSDAALFAAQSGYGKITETVKAIRKELEQAGDGELDGQVAEQLEQSKNKFETAMNDDLNTSVALSVIFDLVRLANKLLQDGNASNETLGAVDEQFGRLGGDVLGIVNFARADELRNRLDEMGIVLEDTPEKTTWRVK